MGFPSHVIPHYLPTIPPKSPPLSPTQPLFHSPPTKPLFYPHPLEESHTDKTFKIVSATSDFASPQDYGKS